MIRDLRKLGVPREKIRLIFNMVDVDESVEEDFAALFGLAKKEKSFVINELAVIYKNDVFPKLKAANKTMTVLLNDETDYRDLMRKVDDQRQKEICAHMISLKRLAKTANRNLDVVFDSLFA
jgi:hypothetical protein